MPIAAVPRYLGEEFKNASPGMRFGMYLTLWGKNRRTGEVLWTKKDVGYEVRGQDWQEHEVTDDNKVAALTEARRLNVDDCRIMRALLARQQLFFDAVSANDATLRVDAYAVAPFTTGLGNEHPLENGFAFLNPYGLPYLSGSGVKGVLRQAARELADGEWGDTRGWSREPRYDLVIDGNPEAEDGRKVIKVSTLDILFGRETPEGESDHLRGALTFWDVIPQIKGDSLLVEIMTPHQSHYYQGKAHAGSITPHESGSPKRICFLTVPPGSSFTFYVICDLARLERLAPDLVDGGGWKVLLEAAFKHAFEWLGFGAKTAVGYGAMSTNVTSSTASGTMTEAVSKPAVEIPETRWENAQLKFNHRNGTLEATDRRGGAAYAHQPRGLELIEGLPPDLRNRLMARQPVSAVAVVRGKVVLRVEPRHKS